MRGILLLTDDTCELLGGGRPPRPHELTLVPSPPARSDVPLLPPQAKPMPARAGGAPLVRLAPDIEDIMLPPALPPTTRPPLERNSSRVYTRPPPEEVKPILLPTARLPGASRQLPVAAADDTADTACEAADGSQMWNHVDDNYNEYMSDHEPMLPAPAPAPTLPYVVAGVSLPSQLANREGALPITATTESDERFMFISDLLTEAASCSVNKVWVKVRASDSFVLRGYLFSEHVRAVGHGDGGAGASDGSGRAVGVPRADRRRLGQCGGARGRPSGQRLGGRVCRDYPPYHDARRRTPEPLQPRGLASRHVPAQPARRGMRSTPPTSAYTSSHTLHSSHKLTHRIIPSLTHVPPVAAACGHLGKRASARHRRRARRIPPRRQHTGHLREQGGHV